MLKYIILITIAAIAGFGIWFISWSGPQQLNFADKAWFWQTQNAANSKTGIAYGKAERQKLDIYSPSETADAKKTRKVLIFFHGGSWYHGERAGYEFLGRAFADRGFVTVIADYRKTPEVKFPAFVKDTAGAIAWTRKNIAEYGGDADQIYLMGHSAGAHIAMLAALDSKWLASEGLNTNIIKGIVGLAGPYDFLPFTGEAAKVAMGDWPKPEETQPITYARGDAAPMLLLTGDRDETVNPLNSKSLAQAIRDVQGRAEVKIYPGVNHYDIIMAGARPFRDKAPLIEDVVGFINSVELAQKNEGANQGGQENPG